MGRHFCAGAIDALIDTMASEAGQVAFSLAKRSIPARRLAQPLASFDALTQANIADLSNPAGTVAPGYLSIAKTAFPRDPLSNVAKEFIVSKDATALLAFLNDNYALLR